MGQKVNPHGLRVTVIRNWDSRWLANSNSSHENITLKSHESIIGKGNDLKSILDKSINKKLSFKTQKCTNINKNSILYRRRLIV